MDAAKLELAAVTARSMGNATNSHAPRMDMEHSIPLTVNLDGGPPPHEAGVLSEAQGEHAERTRPHAGQGFSSEENEQQQAAAGSLDDTHQQEAVHHHGDYCQDSYPHESLWWMLPPPPPPPPPPPAFLFLMPQAQVARSHCAPL